MRDQKAQRKQQDEADSAALAKTYFEDKAASSGLVISPWAVSGAPMLPWTSCKQCRKVARNDVPHVFFDASAAWTGIPRLVPM